MTLTEYSLKLIGRPLLHAAFDMDSGDFIPPGTTAREVALSADPSGPYARIHVCGEVDRLITEVQFHGAIALAFDVWDRVGWLEDHRLMGTEDPIEWRSAVNGTIQERLLFAGCDGEDVHGIFLPLRGEPRVSYAVEDGGFVTDKYHCPTRVMFDEWVSMFRDEVKTHVERTRVC